MEFTIKFTADKDGFERCQDMVIDVSEARETFEWLVKHGYFNIKVYNHLGKLEDYTMTIGRFLMNDYVVKYYSDGNCFHVVYGWKSTPWSERQHYETHSRKASKQLFQDLVMKHM